MSSAGQALPVSLELIIYAQVLALVIAIPLGRLHRLPGGHAASTAHRTRIVFALLALPNFVLALLLAIFVGSEVGSCHRPRARLDRTIFPLSPVDELAVMFCRRSASRSARSRSTCGCCAAT